MARGGKRSGKVGVGYPNRTDLNQPQPVAVQTAPGQVYGAAAQQAAAQKAIPLTTPGVVAPTSPPASAPGPSTPAAPALPSPGSLGGFTRPTERPHEPVTTGSPSGPGGGPEVLNIPSAPQTVGQMLSQLSQGPNSNPDIQFLSNYLSGGR